METNGVKEMAFISSDMVYGSPRQIPIKVDHPLEPNGPYGQSKKEAENLVTDFGANEEHRTIIFRPRMIVGPGRWGVIKKLFFFIKRFNIFAFRDDMIISYNMTSSCNKKACPGGCS